MKQPILCENKSFKFVLIVYNRINMWGGKGGGFYPTHGSDTNTSAKIMFLLNYV